MKKTTAQSMSVSDEEKVVIEVLALGERMKPAAFVREIFYKGLQDYLKSREVHAPARNEEVYEEAVKLIDGDAGLTRMKEHVEFRLGLNLDTRKRESTTMQPAEFDALRKGVASRTKDKSEKRPKPSSGTHKKR